VSQRNFRACPSWKRSRNKFTQAIIGVVKREKRTKEIFQRLIFRRAQRNVTSQTKSEKYSACSIFKSQPRQLHVVSLNSEATFGEKVTNRRE